MNDAVEEVVSGNHMLTFFNGLRDNASESARSAKSFDSLDKALKKVFRSRR